MGINRVVFSKGGERTNVSKSVVVREYVYARPEQLEVDRNLRVTSDRKSRLKRPKKYLSALTCDTNDKGLQRTETPLDSKSKSRIDAPTHQEKKTSQMKPKTYGGYTTQAPMTFCQWKTSMHVGEIKQRYHLAVNRYQYPQRH